MQRSSQTRIEDYYSVRRVQSVSSLKAKYGRIIVVSNRLPITITSKTQSQTTPPPSPSSTTQGFTNTIVKDPLESQWTFKMSSGGLVAGLEGVKKKLPFSWVGWPGKWFSPSQQQELEDILQRDYSCVPVFLEDALAEEYYSGFSNSVLWPLFHYLLEESNTNYSEKSWQAYVEANTKFADVVEKVWRPGDLLWVHDYHLIKLSEILRQRNPQIRIGFFLHIPFPTPEIFQTLPVRHEILKGMLNCDMLGFHTYDYARHFLSACSRLLGLDTTPGGVYYEGRMIAVVVFPVGIDPDKFVESLKQPETQRFIDSYSKQFEGKKILLGVDRMDYIKGIPHRLKALKVLFEKHPEWIEKVVLIQVAVPSREDVEEYKKLKNEVDALVGHINGHYGSLSYSPIHYLYKNVPFPELCSLYAISDVAVVTSIRDGMNLVAQEYIACQNQKRGVLVLSEFAGASRALNGAILVNPFDIEGVADAIHEALTMPEKERSVKYEYMIKYVTKRTASHWGESFIKELDRVSRIAAELDRTPKLTIGYLQPLYARSKHRLLIFNSDGGLIPFAALPFMAKPSRKVTDTLNKLSKDPRNKVYILSGRDRESLIQWFGNLDVGLVAEHGFFMCHKNATDPNSWQSLEQECDFSWKQVIKPIFQYFTDRTPGSFYEEKETSLTWHYRSTEKDFGSFRAMELKSHLDKSTFHAYVAMGDKTIEVRPYQCNYTAVLKKIMNQNPDFDFLLYIGEQTNIDTADDNRIITCGVGTKNQKFYLNDTDEVISLLASLVGNESAQSSK